MANALSVDLRKRIVARWKKGNITVTQLADAFMVGPATVGRLIRLQRETGEVAPRPHAGGRKKVIDEKGERFLRRLLERNPDWTTYEFAEAYNDWAKQPVHRSTILRLLHRLGYTRKKSAFSPRSVRPSEFDSGSRGSRKRSASSPLRVWFLWTKPAQTSR